MSGIQPFLRSGGAGQVQRVDPCSCVSAGPGQGRGLTGERKGPCYGERYSRVSGPDSTPGSRCERLVETRRAVSSRKSTRDPTPWYRRSGSQLRCDLRGTESGGRMDS